MATIEIAKIKTTDRLQPRLQMNFFVVDEYANEMRGGRPFPPIEVIAENGHYWLWDGFHRKKAAEQCGLTEIDANIQEGTLEDAEWLALSANQTHGVRRTNADKRRSVELALDHPRAKQEFETWGKINYSFIARHCGVSVMFVAKIWQEMHPSQISVKTENLNHLNFQKSLKVDRFIAPPIGAKYTPETRQAFDIDYIVKITEPNKSPMTQPMGILLSHDKVEYYTPSIYIEAARQVMGKIDLDPASCDEAQRTVMAANYYTEDNDGLMQKWAGRVWLNPPYSKTGGRSNQEIWAEKLIYEFLQGDVTEAILLVKSALGYNWFEDLWDKWPVCFVRQRLSFTKNNGSDDGQSKHGTALFYLGNNLDKFIDVFSQFGRITTPDGQYINAYAEKVQ